MITDIEDLIEKIRKYTQVSVSESRYKHSVRTAETAAELCERYGMDKKMGYLAGISHDMCKALSPELLISIASRDGKPILEIEKNKPALLHGRAAAVKLKEEFDVDDPDLIEAVANHTFGLKGMCNLSKVLYVADKIEPGREHITEGYLKKLKELDLNELAATVLQENIDLIKDVPLEVTVELGKTKKSIKEILEIAPGTIIELDKITGEPIDILVNGKLVAKGEVVVIEESFGVRVTDILK